MLRHRHRIRLAVVIVLTPNLCVRLAASALPFPRDPAPFRRGLLDPCKGPARQPNSKSSPRNDPQGRMTTRQSQPGRPEVTDRAILALGKPSG